MGNGNILIQIWPMDSGTAIRPAPIGPLRLSSMNQPGKPNQGDRQASPIFQLQMEPVFMNLKGLGSGSYWIEMGRCHNFLPLFPRRGFQKFLLSPGSFYQPEIPSQVSTNWFREVQQKKARPEGQAFGVLSKRIVDPFGRWINPSRRNQCPLPENSGRY